MKHARSICDISAKRLEDMLVTYRGGSAADFPIKKLGDGVNTFISLAPARD
jgi:hypothetical protein